MSINLHGIKSTVQSGTKLVLKKSEELLDITTLNLEIASMQNRINDLYRELGEKCFKQYRKGEFKKESLAKLCGELDELKERIKELNKEIKDIKGC